MTTLTTDPATGWRRTPSLVAGFGLLLMAVVAALANFLAIEGLVTAGDATATAGAIAASEGVFRLGIIGFAVVVVLDVVVAWALYEVFRPVHARISAVAGLLRLAYAAILAVAVAQLPAALTAATDTAVLDAVERFQGIWAFGLGIFGIHLALVGWLAWDLGTRGSRIVGALVVLAGLGYMVDAVGPMLAADYGFEAALYTFVGELVLMGWLLVKGLRRTTPA
jgi:hypothetical protein